MCDIGIEIYNSQNDESKQKQMWHKFKHASIYTSSNGYHNDKYLLSFSNILVFTAIARALQLMPNWQGSYLCLLHDTTGNDSMEMLTGGSTHC